MQSLIDTGCKRWVRGKLEVNSDEIDCKYNKYDKYTEYNNKVDNSEVDNNKVMIFHYSSNNISPASVRQSTVLLIYWDLAGVSSI